MKSIKHCACAIFLFIVLLQNISAQNRSYISGRIVSSDSLTGLAGVTVTLKGTSTGVSADGNGKYSIPVAQSEGTLIFTSTGYVQKEVSFHSLADINVSLSPSAKRLDEVVFIGYGTVKKKDLTGAVGSVKMADLEKAPAGV